MKGLYAQKLHMTKINKIYIKNNKPMVKHSKENLGSCGKSGSGLVHFEIVKFLKYAGDFPNDVCQNCVLQAKKAIKEGKKLNQ